MATPQPVVGPTSAIVVVCPPSPPSKTTIRRLDRADLTPVDDMDGNDILALRKREAISQAVLAAHLNVRTKLISDWERGVKHPSGPSLKLLALIRAKGISAVA